MLDSLLTITHHAGTTSNVTLRPMPIESIPKFTPLAANLWDAIPGHGRKKLLNNVWCGQCAHSVPITNFTGAVKGGDLLLMGKCAVCHSDVARLVESN